jgi:hypothetical protein
MVANATPWGTRMSPPVKPATRSARSVCLLTRGHQRKNGKNVCTEKLLDWPCDVQGIIHFTR